MTPPMMTTKELDRIGKAFAQEYYRLCHEKGIPKDDYVTADEACRILQRSKSWLYKHPEIPHFNRRYSLSALQAYINR